MGKTGFSWKRTLGVTNAKSKIARATGIPTTKQGRKRKVERTIARGCTGGCLIAVMHIFLIILAVVLLIISL